MPIRQFCNSISSIIRNPHINRWKAVARHLQWQYRKVVNGFPCELTISRSKVLATHKSCGVSALINSQGLYNYDNMNLLQLLLKDGGGFFDIGANIGSYTLIASEQEKAEVLSFEPHPITFQLLQENIRRNHRKNVRPFNVALGSKNTTVEMTDVPGSAMNHLCPDKTAQSVSVKCLRVDSVCCEINTAPTVVKIDIEGFEYDALVGFGERLRSIDVFFIEMNGLSNERAAGEVEIHRLLTSYRLNGPFSCDFDRRTLSPARGGGEDAIYISNLGMETLRQKKIVVQLTP